MQGPGNSIPGYGNPGYGNPGFMGPGNAPPTAGLPGPPPTPGATGVMVVDVLVQIDTGDIDLEIERIKNEITAAKRKVELGDRKSVV